ncbi:hypothetical protein COY62_02275 [bacterium (Candidatus Howlettbacteria) CG_4_10_14_0_8_um_filter_40_9]|nr:MAG: hypothetical protein COY62_02275 [bacterium (Candidatus Howlettbacteria) CG_4_10_14_0_8_um_filter_40_9]
MLSKNLQRKTATRRQAKISKSGKKFALILIIVLPVTYGLFNLMHLKSTATKKEDLKVEMGDRPIEKKVNIMIKADGGLNMRKDRNVNAEKVGKIPNGTKLEAKQEIEGWYFVSFDGAEGWISKEYTELADVAKVADPSADWLSFTSDAYAFSAKYPRDWSYKDYGMTLGGESLGFVAFSFSELPAAIPQGSPLFVPIEVKLSTTPQATLQAPYDTMAQKTVSELDISGAKAVKYVYTDTTDNTEKTKIFFSYKGKTYAVAENGGYGEDLDRFLKTFKLK